jgi:hypothetical protein
LVTTATVMYGVTASAARSRSSTSTSVGVRRLFHSRSRRVADPALNPQILIGAGQFTIVHTLANPAHDHRQLSDHLHALTCTCARTYTHGGASG